MISKRTETKGYASSFHEALLLIRNNLKIEMMLVLLGAIFMIVYSRINRLDYVQSVLLNYITPERTASFISFFTIVIGIYAAVWVVLATSVSKFSKILLEIKIDKQLFFVVVAGMFESSLVVMLCIFVPPSIPHYGFVLILSILLSLMSFCKFIIALLMLTKLNIHHIVMKFDEKEREKLDQIVKINDIHQAIKKSKS